MEENLQVMADYSPLRPGLPVSRARQWFEESGLRGKTLDATLKHIAGNAGNFTDALPSLEGARDHGPGGAYADKFELVPGRAVPRAQLIGDNHPTNSGTSPRYDVADAPLVYAVTDATHNGYGSITLDLYRGAHTHVGAAREAGLSVAAQEHVATAFATEALGALRAYVQTGERPTPYVTSKELKGAAFRQLLVDAEKADSNAKVKSLTGSKSGTSFKKNIRIPKHAASRAATEQAFQDQYLAKLPEPLRSRVKLLDVGTEVNIGGSNSGLPHFYALARFGDTTRVVELKQLIPSPVEFTKGTPSLADAERTVATAALIQASPNDLQQPMVLGDKQYVAVPYDDRAREIDLKLLDTEKKLVHMAKNNGRLTGRVLAQTVDPQALAVWMGAMEDTEAVHALRDYAMTYDRQAQRDASGF